MLIKFSTTAHRVLTTHCSHVKGLLVVVGEGMEREGVINREIKRDGADRWIILNSVL